MGKKILVLGTGAQGSTVAQRMDEEPNVDEIICADADHKAVDELVKILKKARGTYVEPMMWTVSSRRLKALI